MPGSFIHRVALPSPLSLLLRVAAASAVVLSLANVGGGSVVRTLVPAIRQTIGWMEDDFVVLDLAVAQEERREGLRLRADLAHVVHLNGYQIKPINTSTKQLSGWYQVIITIGGVLQTALMALIFVLAWPAESIKTLGLRTLMSLPMLAVFTVVDTAMALLANLWMPFVHDLDPGGFWPRIVWDKLLEGGGRLVLGIVLAAIVIALVSRIEDRPEPDNAATVAQARRVRKRVRA
ncbi:MAG TPA: hypothetical protein VGM84_19605 [Steroidobacteraceae bacterium]|jgi:hypothetical protein